MGFRGDKVLLGWRAGGLVARLSVAWSARCQAVCRARAGSPSWRPALARGVFFCHLHHCRCSPAAPGVIVVSLGTAVHLSIIVVGVQASGTSLFFRPAPTTRTVRLYVTCTYCPWWNLVLAADMVHECCHFVAPRDIIIRPHDSAAASHDSKAALQNLKSGETEWPAATFS
jgi:hypothetical protein